MPAATVPSERDRAEEHLHPPEDGVRLADDAVRAHGPRADRLFVDVQLEVDAEPELEEDGEEEDIRHRAVRAGEEGAAAVRVPEDVPREGERDAATL